MRRHEEDTLEEDTLIKISVEGTKESPLLGWAVGRTFMLPSNLVDILNLDSRSGQTNINIDAPLPFLNTFEQTLHLRAAYTNQPPLSSRLPVSYQFVPSTLRRIVARSIGLMNKNRTDKWARFPRWPVDLSADFMADLCGLERPKLSRGQAPVLLSHDIDTPEGLKNLVNMFLCIEEEFGARSTNYIVPCSWPINYSLLDEVVDRGHEIAIHGFDHSNRTAFCEPKLRRERLLSAKPLIDKYMAKGYRSPSLVRTEGLLKDLSEFYKYDSSIPTTGGLFPTPNTGCATSRPFKIGNIIEIPLSMPRDASMRFLAYSPDQIFDIWMNTAELIADSGGVIVLLTHCESGHSGNDRMLECYRRFLTFISNSEKFRWSSPQEVLQLL